MNRNAACIALVLSSAGALGCTEEVGDCDDPRQGRDTVLVGGTGASGSVQYGGQAIINEACAGCHGSQVKGQNRRGAPVGLDFDLVPVETETVVDDRAAIPMLKLEPAELTGLRGRQRRVFEQRNLIWAQVKSGDMPPDGVGASYRLLKSVFDSKEDDRCRRATRSYEGVFEKSSMDILRNWLACNAPIVEATGKAIDQQKDGVAGKAGYQYPACVDVTDPEQAIPFETVFTSVLEPKCSGCHPTQNALDLSDMTKAYKALVSKDAPGCSGEQFVVPFEPDASHLYQRLESNNSCGGKGYMPPMGQLPNAERQLVRRWIASGAKLAADIEDGEAASSKLAP